MASRELCFPAIWTFCERPEAWAVWAAIIQAILSAAAIFFAVRIATTQERRNLSRKADVLVHLIDHAEATAAAVLNAGRDGFIQARSLAAAAGQKFGQIGQALDSVQLQDLPDYRLLAPIQTTARTCHHLNREMQKISAMSTTPEPTSDYLHAVRRARPELEKFYDEAAEVANELVVRSPKQWFYWAFMKLGWSGSDH
ncbi:hypothetical protein [Xanthomonas sp. BRIP62411]|uniref:hypothetical protein n=1 Tax=Xanthomonas sp. BRIP62411 TaxID=2182389 RepID=UPI000F8F5A58|nr:hypothetical protein [Xanthomonas sp. BRIP62411]